LYRPLYSFDCVAFAVHNVFESQVISNFLFFNENCLIIVYFILFIYENKFAWRLCVLIGYVKMLSWYFILNVTTVFFFRIYTIIFIVMNGVVKWFLLFFIRVGEMQILILEEMILICLWLLFMWKLIFFIQKIKKV